RRSRGTGLILGGKPIPDQSGLEFAATVIVTIEKSTAGLAENLPVPRSNCRSRNMTLGNLFRRTARGLAIATAILAAVGLTIAPQPAHAVSSGAAVGIGLGAFAAGTVLGAAANPYYNPYYHSYGYYPPAPAYYYPSAPYYPPRS